MDKRKLVYDKLVSTGYKDSYEDFNKLFDASDANKRKVYDALGKTGYKDSYEDFIGLMQTQKSTADESPKMDARPQVPDVQVPRVAENPAPFTMDAKVRDYVLANKPDMFKSRSGNYATAPFTPGTEPLNELGERLRIAEEMRPTMIKEQNKGALRTLGDDVAALRKDLTAKINAQKEESSGLPVFRSDVGAALLRQTKEPKYASKEALQLQNVEYAEKLLNKSQRLLEEGENPSTSFIQGLGRGFSDSMSDLDKWTAGWADLENALRVKDIVRKIEQNQPLDASEQAVMDAMVTNAATEMLYRDSLGRGYKAGEVTGESLPFMLDMIVGMGSIQSATKPLSKAMMKYATTKLRDMGLKAGSLGMAAGRGVAHLGSGLKNVGLHTATFGAPRVAADYQERGLGQTEVGFDAAGNAIYQGQTGQESGLGAFGKSVISTAAETGSELLGEKFAPILGFVGQATGLNRLTKIMPKQLGAFAKEIKANPGYKEAMKFAKAAHISDPISETMEEEANNLVSVAIGDMSPEQLRDMDMHIDTFLGVAPISVIFGTGGMIGYGYNKYKVNKELKGFERMMQEEYGEDWTEIRNALQNSTIEEAREFVKDILMRGDLPKDRKAQMVQYVYANMQEQALSAMDGQMSPEEIEANKKEIWNAYQLADKRLNFLSPEQKEALDLMSIEEIDGLNVDEKQKQRMIDYKAAKADMDAYQLEIDMRVQRAREQAMAQVEELTNFSTNTVMRVKSGYSENPIHIVRGNVTFNEDGTVDSSKSDKVIYYLDDEGAVKMGSINMIQELVDNTDAATLAKQAANDAQAEVQAQEVEETSPIDVEMTINTPDSSYYIQSKNPDGSYIVNVTTPQGVRIDRMTEQQLQDLLTTQQAAQEEVAEAEQEAVEMSQETTESAVTPQGEESSVSNNEANIMSEADFEASLPKDKDGQLDFNAFTPQQAYEYTARTMGEDAAREDLQADLDNLQSEVNKLSEQVKKASGGARLQARQKLAQAQEQLSSLQEYYNSVVPQAETQTEVQAEEVQPTEFEDRDTYDTLSEINSSLTPEEVDAFVANRQKSFEDEITKLEKKAPKIGTDMNAYLEEKKAFEAEKQELQRKADYWKDIRAELDAMRTQVGEEEAMSVLEDMQPQNAEELAALFLTGMKLNRESYMKETGFGQEEARKMFGQFSKDGVTIDKAGELLENMAREEGYNFFPENEPNAGRNAILNVLSQVRTRGDLFKYLKDRREEQAKKLEEAARNAYESSIEQNFNMTVEEYEQYVEVAEREIKDRLMSEEDYAEFMSIFADETLKNEENGREETDNRGSETSGEVLSGEQSDIEGGNTEAEKSAKPTDGRGDNEGNTAQEDAVEQSTEETKQATFIAVVDMIRSAGIDVEVLTNEQINELASVQGAKKLTVYHGSGALFDEFDHSYMGTGEGAQVFGWGSYVTEVEGIGKSYAEDRRVLDEDVEEKLSDWDSDEDNVTDADIETRNHFGISEPIFLEDGYYVGDADEVELAKSAIDYYGEDIDLSDEDSVSDIISRLLRDMDGYFNKAYNDAREEFKKSLYSKVYMYTVEIPDNTGDNYLAWEKKVGEDILMRIGNLLETEGWRKETMPNGLNKFVKEENSIVLNSNASGADLYEELKVAFDSDKDASEFLSRAGFTGISYPAQYTTGGRSDNARNYVIFNDRDLKITSHISFLKDASGKIYGLAIGNKIYLNKSSLNTEAPIHEYTHIWDEVCMKNNPELWKKGVELMKQTSLWNEVKNDPNYSNLQTDDEIASEVHSRLSGKNGAKVLNGIVSDNADATSEIIKQKLKGWINDFWEWAKSVIGKWTEKDVEKVSVEDFVNMPLKDLILESPIVDIGKAEVAQPTETQQAIQAAEAEVSTEQTDNIQPDENKQYVYRLTIRPYSIGTQPEGEQRIDDGSKFGAVAYDRKLTREEIENFSLQPITEAKELEGKFFERPFVKGNVITYKVTSVDADGNVSYEQTYKGEVKNFTKGYIQFRNEVMDKAQEVVPSAQLEQSEGIRKGESVLDYAKRVAEREEKKAEDNIRFREDEQPIRRSIVDRDLNELSKNLTGEDFSQYPYEDRRTNSDVEGDIWYGYSEPQYKGVNAMDSDEVPEPIKDILSDNEYEIDKADMVETLQNNIEFEGGYEEESAQPYVEALNWLAENGDDLVMSDKVNLIIDAPSDDVRFREDDKNLIAVHNLSEESLQKAFELGGFPMPSIAVTSKEIGHAEFGDISLVFDKETINPTNRMNKVYAGDAWTPVFPQVDIKISDKVANDIRRKVDELLKEDEYARELGLNIDSSNLEDKINRSGSFSEAYKNNYALRLAFLKHKGIKFKPVLIDKKFSSKVDNATLKEIVKVTGMKASDLMNLGYNETMKLEPIVREVVSAYREKEIERLTESLSPEKRENSRALAFMKRDANRELDYSELNNLFYDAYQYERQGDKKIVDTNKLREKLDSKFNKKLQQEFEAWLDELSEGIIEKRGIRNERDLFTPLGNRRSWEALYDEITLDNVVRAMRAQSEKGGEGVFGGSIFGAAQKEVSSIDELKQIARERLAEIDADEYEAERDRITSRLSSLPIPGVSSSFGGTLDMIENITDAVKTSQTSSGIYKYLKKYYPKITKEITDEIADIVKDIQKMSTRYFEAKPYRAVGFDEVKLAVVPKGTSQEVIDKLEQYGIPVKTYKKGDEAARRRILNTAAKKQNLLFRFIGEQGAARLDAAEEATTRLDNLNVAREMEQAGKDAKAIKMATGWERGADGKWRYETADAKKIDLSGNIRWLKRHPEYVRRRELNKKANSAAILGTEPLTEAEQAEYDELKRSLPDVSLNETQINPDRMKLADIVDDDALFEAYPELADIDVKIVPMDSNNPAAVATVGDLLDDNVRKELRLNEDMYNEATASSNRGYAEHLARNIEHEIQHLIQDREGFAKGGSPSMPYTFNQSNILAKIEEANAFIEKYGDDFLVEARKGEDKDFSKDAMFILKTIGRNKKKMSALDGRFALMEMYAQKGDVRPLGVEGYKRLAGEVEARNVQSRLEMTPEQRRSTLASETEDVAREDQIFLYDAMQADSRYITEDYKDVYVPEEYREYMDAPVKREPAYDADTVFNYVYRMSPEYNRPMMEARKGILIPGTGEVNIPAAQRLRDTARDILGRKKQALLDAMANASMAARRYLMSIVNDIDDALKFFDELAEGKDVWRWKDPYYRNLGMRAENNPEIKKRGFAKHAREVASKFGVPVTVHHSLDSVPAGAAKNAIANGRKVKGWYDTKSQTIHIYMPNAASLEDVEATILHEGVAHYGLRQLVGEENFDDFLDEVFANVSDDVRKRILNNLAKYKYDARVATEEYLASLAENGVDTSTWNRIKQAFKELLRKVGINVKITDNELKYILWRSAQNLRMSNPLDLAQDVAMQYQMGVGNYLREGTTRFRDTDTSISDYNETFNKAGYWGREAWQDSMLSLKNLQDIVEEQSGTPIKEFENAYMAENQLSRLNKAQSFKFWDEYMKPLADELGRMVKSKIPYQDIADYMMLSHGIERNIEMTNRERVEAEYNKTAKTDKAQAEKDREDAYNKFYSDIKALRKQYKGYDYLKALVDYFGEADDYSATEAILSRDGNAHTDFQTDALAKVKDFEDAHNVDNLRKLTKAATDAVIRKSFESGMMNRETYNRVKDMFAYYVPLRGWEGQTAEDVYDYMQDANPVNSALKKMKGRKTIPDDVFATIGNMGESAIVQGNRNAMKQKFYNMAVNHPTDLITLTKAWYVPNINGDMELSLPQIDATDDAETIAQKIKDHDELMRNTPGATQKKQGLNIDYPITSSSKMQHAVVVKIGGKDYVMYVNGNPRAAQAVNGLTNPDAETNPALRATYWLNRQLSALYTSRNPEFVVSNFMRDYIEAGTVISAKEDANYNKVFRKNMRKSLVDVIKGMRGTLTGQAGDYYKEFTENGGEMGYMTLSDVNAYKKKLKKQMDEITGRRGSAKKAFSYITDAVDAMNRYAETISRFATYRTSREMGRSIEQSIKDASDVTVNFSKKGSGFKALGGKMIKDGSVSTLAPKFFGMTAGTTKMLYLFINPAIQSLANWGYIAKHNKKALIGTVSAFALAGYVMPIVNQMLWNLFGDDDKDNPYNDLPEWIRRNNLCIGVDKYLTIPLPHTLRAFFGMGEMAYQVSTGRKDMTPGEMAYETIGQVSALLPLDPLGNEGDIVKTLTPSYAKGIAEAYIWNEDFMGKPIAKITPFNELDPEYKRVYKGTAGWLIDTSKFFNDLTAGKEAGRDFRKGVIDFNPAKIEHIGESYFGGMWKFLNNSGKTLYYTGKSIVEGEKSDDLVLRNVPWVRKFVATVDERSAFSSINEEYFDLVKEMEQFDYEVKGVKKSIPQDPERYTWQYEELMNGEDMKRYKIYEGYKGVLDYLYQISKQLEGDERDEIEMQIMGLRRELVEELRK